MTPSPPFHRQVLQRDPHSYARSQISSEWLEVGEGTHISRSPHAARFLLGRVCMLVAPPCAGCRNCKLYSEGRERAKVKTSCPRAGGSHQLFPSSSPLPCFHPGHLYLKGWDPGRDGQTSRSWLSGCTEGQVRVSVGGPRARVGGWPSLTPGKGGRGGVQPRVRGHQPGRRRAPSPHSAAGSSHCPPVDTSGTGHRGCPPQGQVGWQARAPAGQGK